MIDWRWTSFEQLSINELYEILKVRQQVFTVEQNCVYQDVDGLDQNAWHLSAWRSLDEGNNELVAYCRVIHPSYKYAEPSIGRLLTIQKVRSAGVGKQLLAVAIKKIEEQYPSQDIRISAQSYLHNFYAQYGFKKVSEPYLEDSIPHIEMLKQGIPLNSP